MAGKITKTQGSFNFDDVNEGIPEQKAGVVEEVKIVAPVVENVAVRTVNVEEVTQLLGRINSKDLNYAQKRNEVLELLRAENKLLDSGVVLSESIIAEIKSVKVLFGFGRVQSQHSILEVIKNMDSFLVQTKDKNPIEELEGTQATPYDIVYAYVSVITPVAKQLQAQIYDVVRETGSTTPQQINLINNWEVHYAQRRVGGEMKYIVKNTKTGEEMSGTDLPKYIATLIMSDVLGKGASDFLARTHMKKILKQVYLAEDGSENLGLSRLNREMGIFDKKIVDAMAIEAMAYDNKSFNTVAVRTILDKAQRPSSETERATARDNKLTSIKIEQMNGKFVLQTGTLTKSKVDEFAVDLEEIRTLVSEISVINMLEIDEKVSAQKILEIKQMLKVIKELKMTDFKESFDLSFRHILNYNANGIFFSANLGGGMTVKPRIVLTARENGYDARNSVEVKGSAFIHEFGHLYSMATDAMKPDYKHKLISLLSSFNDYEKSNAQNPEYYANPEEVFARATEVSLALVDANFFKVYADLKNGKTTEEQFHNSLMAGTPTTAGVSRTLTEYTRSAATGFSPNHVYFDVLKRTPDELAFMVKEFSKVVGYADEITTDITMDKIYLEISTRKHVNPRRATDISLNYLNRLTTDKMKQVMIANLTEKDSISNYEYMTLLVDVNFEDTLFGDTIRVALEQALVEISTGEFDLFLTIKEREVIEGKLDKRLTAFHAEVTTNKYPKRNFDDRKANASQSKLALVVEEVRRINPSAGFQEMCDKTLEALKKDNVMGLIASVGTIAEKELMGSKAFNIEMGSVGMIDLPKTAQDVYLAQKYKKLKAVSKNIGEPKAEYKYLVALSRYAEEKGLNWTQRIVNQEFESHLNRELSQNERIGVESLFEVLAKKYNQKVLTRIIQENFVLNEVGQKAILGFMSKSVANYSTVLVDAEQFKDEMETLTMMTESERKFKGIILSYEAGGTKGGSLKTGTFLKTLAGANVEIQKMPDSKERVGLMKELADLVLVEGREIEISDELRDIFERPASDRVRNTTMETNETKFMSDGDSYFIRGVYIGDLIGNGKKTAIGKVSKGGFTKVEIEKVENYLRTAEKRSWFKQASMDLVAEIEASKLKLEKAKVAPTKK